jgi:hypothetical protein
LSPAEPLELKPDFYYTDDPILGSTWRYGAIIHIEWQVTGDDPTACEFHLQEPKGGVTGTSPEGKFKSDAKDVKIFNPYDDPLV